MKLSSTRLGLAGLLFAVGSSFGSPLEQSFDVGALALLNVKVSATTRPGSAPSLLLSTSRTYLDGYNLPDSSGDIGEGAPGLASRTSNFGYVNSQQIDLAAGTLALHALVPVGGTYLNQNASGSAGVEFKYRILYQTSDQSAFGVELRAGRTSFDSTQRGAIPVPFQQITDTYALGGVVPPAAPYSGAFSIQPGTPRIGDTATRTTSTIQGTAQGSRSFDSDGWLMRLGAVWRTVRTNSFSLEVHGGPAVLAVKESFAINQTITSSANVAFSDVTTASRRLTTAAAYAGLAGSVRFSRNWEISAGADWFDAGQTSVHSPSTTARFDYSKVLLANLGVGYRF
jgi:hypothetical protein